MNFLRIFLLAALAAGTTVSRGSEEFEQNAWPVSVRKVDRQGHTQAWAGAGPLLFRRTEANGDTTEGFRPLWVLRHNSQGDFRAGFFLYPIFSYTVDDDVYRWSLFELIKRTGPRAGTAADPDAIGQKRVFEVWPFWFSRESPDPQVGYRALFPVYGTVRNKLGFERLSWTLFPFYVENEKRGAVTTSTPWPFVRVTRGTAQGWAIWPLYSTVERPGVSRENYILWPFGYHRIQQPSAEAPAGTPPREEIGALPFYARSTGPGYRGETFLWPFFGYTDRTAPLRYHETRYFWPLLVQGRGEQRRINRWAPFYSNSVIKGYDKTWFGWPLVRHATWTDLDRNLTHERTQFLYFLFWSETQRSATRPGAAPAGLHHVWPLFSSWDNGAGQKQFQAFSPLEVFFPGNEKVRNSWTPLFALFRHEERGPGQERTSFLWNLVSWERDDANARREFHLGPLVSSSAGAGGRRIAIANGLFGFRRAADTGGWRMFWFNFNSGSPSTAPAAR